MKRVLFAIILLIFGANIGFADDLDMGSGGDLWDNFNTQVNPLAKDQKAVSDEQFDSIIDKLKSKRQKKPKQMKGESIQQSNETEEITEAVKELPVICISVPLKVNEDGILPVGHYQVVGEMVEGQPRIKLYQAHFLMADFPATETNDDFDEPEINFVNLVDYSDTQLKIIFGSVDFNAFALVDIAE